jgi:hypothetical protein
MQPPRSGSNPGLKSLNWPIDHLPGLAPEDCQQLQDLGIRSTFDLLRLAQSRHHQTQLAQKLHLHLHHIQKWIALADLARIPAVGLNGCGLLLHAGIPSVTRLAELNPGLLHKQVLKLQVSTYQTPNLCPDPAELSHWINQAKQLPKLPIAR